MLYRLGPGKIENQAFEEHRRYKKPLPKSILQKPFLQIGLELYDVGFLDLDSCRPEFTKNIPLTSMMEYCRVWGMCSEQAEDFLWLVSRLDGVYLKEIRSQMDQQNMARNNAPTR